MPRSTVYRSEAQNHLWSAIHVKVIALPTSFG